MTVENKLKLRKRTISNAATLVIEKNVTESLEAVVLTRSSSQPQSSYEAAVILFEFELTKILTDKINRNKSYDIADHKRSRDDIDKDRDPSVGSDQGMKRKNSSKDVVSSRDSKEPSHIVKDSDIQQDYEYVTGDNDEQPADMEVTKDDWFKKPKRPPTPNPDWKLPTSFDELNDTSFDFSAFVMNKLKNLNPTQEILVRPAFNLLKGTYKSIAELEYHFEECFKATTKRLEWHNHKNKLYPFDLRMPLPLIQDHRGRQIIPQDYFINNDLEYLKGRDLNRRYLISVTKTKAATYDLKWIEDLIPKSWNPVQVKCEQHAYLGTSHWGPKCQSFYGYASNITSSKDVYSRRRIIMVTRLKIMKKYDYGHWKRLMFVEMIRSYIHLEKTYYHSKAGGIIYVDPYRRKRLMCDDELYKFSDGTLHEVRSALHDIAMGIRMEYMPMRKWSNLDKRRAWVMIRDIDRRFIRGG
uniref:Uncharacterized protein n=1 Tax=Tanacetum cinerariifolium TaxID=118510 RepID=A0A6L2J950_TANCI|nr:hypothetical protein [Tanacetum cinerariifolium]